MVVGDLEEVVYVTIALLNKAVGDELTAVHQYMYFHFHCDDQGYDLYDIEMKNIEKFGDQYLALQSIERSRSIGG
jgi:bacterioferritin